MSGKNDKKNTVEPSWTSGFAILEPYFSLKNDEGLVVPLTLAESANAARRRLRHKAYEDHELETELRKKALMAPVPDEVRKRPEEEADFSPRAGLRFPTNTEEWAAAKAKQTGAAKPESKPKPKPKPNAALRNAPPRRTGVPPVEVFTKKNFVGWQTARQLHGTRDRERVEVVKAILDRLAATGRWRPAVLPTNWRQSLAALLEEMPNFSEVIRTVDRTCTLAEHGNKPLKIPPILVVGKPGVGKSRFAKHLAKAFATTSYL